MKRVDALACLQAHEAELKQLGVISLYMFGSTAREEARGGGLTWTFSLTITKTSSAFSN